MDKEHEVIDIEIVSYGKLFENILKVIVAYAIINLTIVTFLPAWFVYGFITVLITIFLVTLYSIYDVEKAIDESEGGVLEVDSRYQVNIINKMVSSAILYKRNKKGYVANAIITNLLHILVSYVIYITQGYTGYLYISLILIPIVNLYKYRTIKKIANKIIV